MALRKSILLRFSPAKAWVVKEKIGVGWKTISNAQYSTWIGANLHTSDNKVASQLCILLGWTDAGNKRRTFITTSAVSTESRSTVFPMTEPGQFWKLTTRLTLCESIIEKPAIISTGIIRHQFIWILRGFHRATIHPTHVQDVGDFFTFIHLGVAVASLPHCRDVGAELITEGLCGVGDFRGAWWAIARTNWVSVTHYGRGSRYKGGVDC